MATVQEEWFKKSVERAWKDGKAKKPPERPSEDLMKSNPHEIALEMLSRDWLDGTDLNTRLYLVEEILPVLVMSLEQLLTVVDRRGLHDQEGFCDDFNPVNYVAEYLMRNNPRYPQIKMSGVPSRYHRGLKEVRAELKRRVIHEEEKVIETVKGQLREKRAHEVEERKLKLQEEERRRKIMRKICDLWKRDGVIVPQQVNMLYM